MRYDIYAGLGGAEYQYTEEFDDANEAINCARELAVEEYQSYEGLHGLPSYQDIVNEYCEETGVIENDLTDDDYMEIDAIYDEEMEGWLSYRAVPAHMNVGYNE